MKSLTPAERVELEKLCEMATPGPWDPRGMFDRSTPEYIFPQYVTGTFTPEWQGNLNFIATSREALPRALHTIAEQEKVIAELREALNWCMDNLGAGIEWGGPFDKKHKQGVYHCTHCDARWKPQGDGTEHHKPDCGLTRTRKALEGK